MRQLGARAVLRAAGELGCCVLHHLAAMKFCSNGCGWTGSRLSSALWRSSMWGTGWRTSFYHVNEEQVGFDEQLLSARCQLPRRCQTNYEGSSTGGPAQRHGHGNGNAVGPTSALAGLCLAAVRSLGMRLVHMVRVTNIRRYKKNGYKNKLVTLAIEVQISYLNWLSSFCTNLSLPTARSGHVPAAGGRCGDADGDTANVWERWMLMVSY